MIWSTVCLEIARYLFCGILSWQLTYTSHKGWVTGSRSNPRHFVQNAFSHHRNHRSWKNVSVTYPASLLVRLVCASRVDHKEEVETLVWLGAEPDTLTVSRHMFRMYTILYVEYLPYQGLCGLNKRLVEKVDLWWYYNISSKKKTNGIPWCSESRSSRHEPEDWWWFRWCWGGVARPRRHRRSCRAPEKKSM